MLSNLNLNRYAEGTMDTKGDELNYLAAKMRALGANVKTVDVSANPPSTPDASSTPTTTATTDASSADEHVSIQDVMRHHPNEASRFASHLPKMTRAEAVSAVSVALRAMLCKAHSLGEVSGVVGIGGSGGTSLITGALKELPIGTPKLMVSTVAAGDVAAYVGHSDLVMMVSAPAPLTYLSSSSSSLSFQKHVY